jgi:hypothetical protein
MNDFWKGETYAIVKAMKATGNQEGVIQRWKEVVALWAQMHRTDADAQAVNAWLPHWHPRPFYTAEELAPIWPALAIAVGHTVHWPPVPKSSGRLEFELDYAGLPRLNCPAPRNGELCGPNWSRYFVVERLHYWTSIDRTREEIEREFDAHR